MKQYVVSTDLVFCSELSVRVCVDRDEVDLATAASPTARRFIGEFLEDWGKHLAWPTPAEAA